MILASIPSPTWQGFSIGGFTIHAYALCILLGIIAALWLTNRRWKAKGGTEDQMWDIAIWAIPAGIIGGRLYHVISSPDAYFGPDGDLWLIPQIWRGGLGIWGAAALGALGALIGARRSGVRLSTFLDAAAPGVLLAQAIGRWGNWFNQELFGAPTTLPWGLHIDYQLHGAINPNWPGSQYPPDTLFHPTFLYECIWNLIGVALLIWAGRKFKLGWGQVFWSYVCFYTIGRLWIEMLRIDDAEHILGLRLNVWTSIVVFILGAAMFVVSRRKHPEPETTVYMPGKDPASLAATRRHSTATGAIPVIVPEARQAPGETPAGATPATTEPPATTGAISRRELREAEREAAAKARNPLTGLIPKITPKSQPAAGESAPEAPAKPEMPAPGIPAPRDAPAAAPAAPEESVAPEEPAAPEAPGEEPGDKK